MLLRLFTRGSVQSRKRLRIFGLHRSLGIGLRSGSNFVENGFKPRFKPRFSHLHTKLVHFDSPLSCAQNYRWNGPRLKLAEPGLMAGHVLLKPKAQLGSLTKAG